MIMIEFTANGIKANGHAEYSKHGNDIYCAGISAVLMGALNWFNRDEMIYYFSDGEYLLEIKELSKENIEKLSLLKIQLQSLAHGEYQKYIKIIDWGKQNENG